MHIHIRHLTACAWALACLCSGLPLQAAGAQFVHPQDASIKIQIRDAESDARYRFSADDIDRISAELAAMPPSALKHLEAIESLRLRDSINDAISVENISGTKGNVIYIGVDDQQAPDHKRMQISAAALTFQVGRLAPPSRPAPAAETTDQWASLRTKKFR